MGSFPKLLNACMRSPLSYYHTHHCFTSLCFSLLSRLLSRVSPLILTGVLRQLAVNRSLIQIFFIYSFLCFFPHSLSHTSLSFPLFRLSPLSSTLYILP